MHLKGILSLFLAYTLSFPAIAQLRSYAFRINEGGKLLESITVRCLERIDRDSLHYRVEVADEQFRSLGKIEFNDLQLEPMSAAKGDGLLCIAYLRHQPSSLDFLSAVKKPAELYFQFIDSSGKILFDHHAPATAIVEKNIWRLRNPICLYFVKGQGFLYAYGEGQAAEGTIVYHGMYQKSRLSDKVGLLAPDGKRKWLCEIPCGLSSNLRLLGNTRNAWLLRTANTGIFPELQEITRLDMETGQIVDSQLLLPEQKAEFNNLMFEFDHKGRPSLAGLLITRKTQADAYDEVRRADQSSRAYRVNLRAMLRDVYAGLCTIYWEDKQAHTFIYPFEEQGFPNTQLEFDSTETRLLPCHALKDTAGNTHFFGPLYREQRKAVLYSPGYGQITLDEQGRLLKTLSYPTDTVRNIFINSDVRAAARVFCSYFPIVGKPYLAIGDESTLNIVDYRNCKKVHQLKRSSEQTLYRFFYCSRDGHISVYERNAAGEVVIYEEPLE